MNKKQVIINTGIIILTTLITLISVVPISYHNENITWMKEVNGNKKIKELSIPGTHDSGSTHSFLDVSGICQTLSIKDQLNVGVRFFDIRLQMDNNKFKIVHSFVDQKLSFDSVIKDMTTYIRNNPSEFLIMSIKEEADSINSYKDFNTLFKEYCSSYLDVISYDSTLPEHIKDARGKIYILSRFNTDIGISAYSGWKDDATFELNDLYIQDEYAINDISIKKEGIDNALNYSKTNVNNKLVLNFTSCYLEDEFPPTYAGKAASIINPWFIDTIKDNNDKLGIIIADFMSKDLSSYIYERNL